MYEGRRAPRATESTDTMARYGRANDATELDHMPAHKVRAAWLAGLVSNDEYGQWVERRTFAKRAAARLERTYKRSN